MCTPPDFQTGFPLRLLLTSGTTGTTFSSITDSCLQPLDDASIHPHFRVADGSAAGVCSASTQLIGKEITCCRRASRESVIAFPERDLSLFWAAESADLHHHHTLSPLNFLSDYNGMMENRRCVLYDREEAVSHDQFLNPQAISLSDLFAGFPGPST